MLLGSLLGACGSPSTAQTGSESSDTGDEENAPSCGLVHGEPLRFGARARTMVGTKDTVYLGSVVGLEVYELSDFASPQRIGELVLHPFDVYGSTLDGSVLMLHDADEVALVDVSAPAAPSLLTRWSESEGIQVADMAGGRLALRTEGQLSLYDVSNPSAPVLLESIERPSTVEAALAMTSSRLFHAEKQADLGISELRVYDLSTGELVPGEVLDFGGLIPTAGLKAEGLRALVISGTGSSGELRVVDATLPSDALVLGPVSVGFRRHLALDGELAVSLYHTGEVLDLSGAPQVVAELDDYAYYGDGSILDQGRYTVPELESGFPVLDRLDLSEPTAPVQLPRARLPWAQDADQTLALALVDELLIVSERAGGLRSYDIQQPSAPQARGQLSSDSGFSRLMSEGEQLWAREDATWVRIDLNDPEQPTRGDSLPAYSELLGLHGEHGFVYRAGELEVYDLSAAPTQASTLAPGYHPGVEHTFAILGDRLVLSLLGARWIYDISDPATPVQLGEWAAPNPVALPPIGPAVGEVIVTHEGDILGFNDDGSPIEYGSIDIAGGEVVAHGSSLVHFTLIDGESSATVFDLSDPAAPLRSAPTPAVPTDGGRSFAVREGLAAIGSRSRAFTLLGLACEASD